jgi:hypothetical protein
LSEGNEMKKKIAFFLTVFILLLLLTGCMSLFPQEDEMLSIPVPTFVQVEYRTIKPQRGDIIKRVNVLGTVVADYHESIDMKFNVDGYINEIFVENEQYVEEGQIIATLKEPDNKEKIEQEYTESLNSYLNIQENYSQNRATEYDLRKAEIAYEHAKEKYDELLYYLESLQLKALKSGYIVSLKEMQESDPIGKTLTVCAIAEKIDKMVQATTTTDNVSKLPTGTEVTLVIKDTEYKGYVSNSSGNTLRFKLFEDMTFMQNGDIIEVYLVLETAYDVLMVPSTVITFTEDNKGDIRVLSDGAPVTYSITFGLRSDTHVEIFPDQGITEDTLIITGVR